jgi:hypothetical protein
MTTYIPILMQHDARRVLGWFDSVSHEATFYDDTRVPTDWLPGGAWMILEYFDNPVHPERYVKRARLMAFSCDPDAPPALRMKEG